MDEVVKAELLRLHDEETRQNKRIENLELKMENLTEMNLNIQKIATNTEIMGKEIANQSKLLSKQDERLNSLERQPADQWSDLKKTAVNIVIGAICGGVVAVIGALFVFGIKTFM